MSEQRYCVHGELDSSNADFVRAELMSMVADTDDDLVLDCGDLRFIDKSGASVFAGVWDALARAGRGFRVVNLQAIPRRKFETLGLVDRFGIENGR